MGAQGAERINRKRAAVLSRRRMSGIFPLRGILPRGGLRLPWRRRADFPARGEPESPGTGGNAESPEKPKKRSAAEPFRRTPCCVKSELLFITGFHSVTEPLPMAFPAGEKAALFVEPAGAAVFLKNPEKYAALSQGGDIRRSPIHQGASHAAAPRFPQGVQRHNLRGGRTIGILPPEKLAAGRALQQRQIERAAAGCQYAAQISLVQRGRSVQRRSVSAVRMPPNAAFQDSV